MVIMQACHPVPVSGMYHGEKFNSITHLIGSALSFMGFCALLTVSIQHRDPWMIASFSIFGFTLVLLYTMSTLYHSFYPPEFKKLVQKMDHVSIYLLIAGSYTPICWYHCETAPDRQCSRWSGAWPRSVLHWTYSAAAALKSYSYPYTCSWVGWRCSNTIIFGLR